MDKSLKSGFRFDRYFVDHIEFKLNRELLNNGEIINVDLDTVFEVGFSLDPDEKQALISLDCKIFDEFYVNNFPFYIHVRLVGEFSIEGDASSNDFVKFCEVNGTAALFPYLRSTVSTITALAGVPSLNLPLINIYKLIESQKQEEITNDDEKES